MMNSQHHQQQQQCILSSILSIPLFCETELIHYKKLCQDCFQQWIQQNAILKRRRRRKQRHHDRMEVEQYNDKELYNDLYHSIDWLSICNDYNRRYNNNNKQQRTVSSHPTNNNKKTKNCKNVDVTKMKTTTTKTASMKENNDNNNDNNTCVLTIILECFHDPSIIPIPILMNIIIPILFRIILYHHHYDSNNLIIGTTSSTDTTTPTTTTSSSSNAALPNNDDTSNIPFTSSQQRILQFINMILFRQVPLIQLYDYLPNLMIQITTNTTTNTNIDSTTNNNNKDYDCYNKMKIIIQRLLIIIQFSWIKSYIDIHQYRSYRQNGMLPPFYHTYHNHYPLMKNEIIDMYIRIMLHILSLCDTIISSIRIKRIKVQHNQKRQPEVNDKNISSDINKKKRKYYSQHNHSIIDYYHGEMNEEQQEKVMMPYIRKQYNRQQQQQQQQQQQEQEQDATCRPTYQNIISYDSNRNTTISLQQQQFEQKQMTNQYNQLLLQLYQLRGKCMNIVLSFIQTSIIKTHNNHNIQNHHYTSNKNNMKTIPKNHCNNNNDIMLTLLEILIDSMMIHNPIQYDKNLKTDDDDDDNGIVDLSSYHSIASYSPTLRLLGIIFIHLLSLSSIQDCSTTTIIKSHRTIHKPHHHHTNTNDYYNSMILYIWKRIQNILNTSNDIYNIKILLNYYSEILIQCSYYDDHPTSFFDMMKPFILYMNMNIIPYLIRRNNRRFEQQQQRPQGDERAQEQEQQMQQVEQNRHPNQQRDTLLIDTNLDVDSDVWYDSVIREHVFAFLQCFAYILSRRGKMMISIMNLVSPQSHSSNSSNSSCSDNSSTIKKEMLNQDHDTQYQCKKNREETLYQCNQDTENKQNHEVFVHFRSLIANLSLLCDDVNDWIDNDNPLSHQEKCKRIEGLQVVGILSVCHLDSSRRSDVKNVVILIDDDSDNDNDMIISSDQTKSISKTSISRNYFSLPLFTDSEIICDTASRVRPFLEDQFKELCIDHIFSRYSDHNAIPYSYMMMLESSKVSGGDPIITESIRKCISYNEDLVRQIFSYLPYKRLIKMRYVCRLWKTISEMNEIWLLQYQSRYGQPMIQQKYQLKKRSLNKNDKSPQSKDDTTDNAEKDILNDQDAAVITKHNHDHHTNQDNNNLDQNWRYLFEKRWQLERDIKHKYCTKDGSKWRLCPFIDCMKILKSKMTADKHIQMHQKKDEKKKTIMKKTKKSMKT